MANAPPSVRILLVLTACVSFAAGLAWFVERRPAPVAEPGGAGAVVAPEPQRPGAISASTPPAPSPSPGERSTIPYTQLPLRLLATVVGDKPALSLATIADSERGAPAVMGEGQLFAGRPVVRLAAIERERVLIDNDGVLEQLILFRGQAAAVASSTFELTPEERERRRDLARRLRELTDAGSGALRPPERGGLLAEGNVSAAYDGEELIGVQIDDIREGGLYDRIGLRNGDVVTDINGVSLRDSSAMAKVVLLAATSDVLKVEGYREGGEPITVEVPTDQIEPLVAPE